MFDHVIDGDLQLKILEMRHAEELFMLSDKNRSYLRKWLPWVDRTFSVEQTKEYIEFSLELFSKQNGFNLGIFYQGMIVGCVGLHSIDWANKKTSIGYWLAEDYQGKGIMTRACQAIIDYVFSEYSLNRVEIRAALENHKSRSIPERLQFVQEGIVREAEWINDRYYDHVVYGMLETDWKQRNSIET